MLGLGDRIAACLFDLDGVLTPTAAVHARAWKQTFDDFLKDREGDGFEPFDEVADYERYVDGKPRYEGVESFLEARGIDLAEGAADDSPEEETIHGLGNRKNELVVAMIERDGVAPYEGSLRYLEEVERAGLPAAVVSSSSNCKAVLKSAGIEGFLAAVVDGEVARDQGLAGKPRPDTFLAAARMLRVAPARAAVFEDALAGVEAGRAGEFGCVVGVDRLGHAEALREHGADVVVEDLAELLERT